MTKQEKTGINAVRAMVQNRIDGLNAETDKAFARFSAACADVADCAELDDQANIIRSMAWDKKEQDLAYIHHAQHFYGLVIKDIDNLLGGK